MGSEFSLRTELKDSRHFLFYRFKTKQTGADLGLFQNSHKPYIFMGTMQKQNTFNWEKFLEKCIFLKNNFFKNRMLLEYSLRIISGAWRAGINLKTDSDSTHQN
jgi:hypothetical protein